jgi:hypothetical protein
VTNDLLERIGHLETELEELRGLHERVLMLEAGFKAPMSIANGLIAQALDERRRAHAYRVEALNKAKVEAERVGHRGPVDDFVRRLKAGEFDQAPGRPQ